MNNKLNELKPAHKFLKFFVAKDKQLLLIKMEMTSSD